MSLVCFRRLLPNVDRRKFIKTTGIAAGTVSIAGCMGNDGNGNAGGNGGTTTTNGGGNKTTNNESRDGDEDFWNVVEEINEKKTLKVTQTRLYRTENGAGVYGVVKNTGNEPYSEVEAEVTLYDDKGEAFNEFIDESETDEIDSLSPGGKWDFNVYFQEADWNRISKYVIDVSGEKE